MGNMQVRARWLAASFASAVIVSFAGAALGQAAAPGGNAGAGAGVGVGVGAGAGGAGVGVGVDVGAGGNVGAGQGQGNTPIPMPGPNPDVNLNQVANATGAIKAIDKEKRQVTLDNGETYFLATNFDINTLTPGQRVTISYNLEGADRRIVKIDPPRN
jgi:hypothetical protein